MSTTDHHSEIVDVLRAAVSRATTELFALYATPLVVEPSPEEPPIDDGVAAILGFAGTEVRGALLLFVARGFAESLHPTNALATDDEVRDLLGEFSNMLLGRVKSLLLRRRLVLMLATPTTLCGRALRLRAPAEGASWQAFGSPRGSLYVRLDANFEPQLALPEEEPVDEIVEGDLMLF